MDRVLTKRNILQAFIVLCFLSCAPSGLKQCPRVSLNETLGNSDYEFIGRIISTKLEKSKCVLGFTDYTGIQVVELEILENLRGHVSLGKNEALVLISNCNKPLDYAEGVFVFYANKLPDDYLKCNLKSDNRKLMILTPPFGKVVSLERILDKSIETLSK